MGRVHTVKASAVGAQPLHGYLTCGRSQRNDLFPDNDSPFHDGTLHQNLVAVNDGVLQDVPSESTAMGSKRSTVVCGSKALRHSLGDEEYSHYQTDGQQYVENYFGKIDPEAPPILVI